MTNRRRVAAVTGATGFLGKLLCNRLERAGWETVALVREPERIHGASRRFALGEPIPPDLLDGVDALLHCAYDLKATDRAEVWRTNVKGSCELLAYACDRVETGIVLSSMSAYPGTTQVYGQAKLTIEDCARAHGAYVVRPGLVYGPSAGGMAGTLSRLARLPVAPSFSGAYQYTIHQDDFADVVVLLLEQPPPSGAIIGLAHPERVPFRSLVAAFAPTGRRPPLFVSVNWRLLYAVLRAAEALPVALPVRADSLLGLVRPAPSVPGGDVLDSLNVQVREFASRQASEANQVSRY